MDDRSQDCGQTRRPPSRSTPENGALPRVLRAAQATGAGAGGVDAHERLMRWLRTRAPAPAERPQSLQDVRMLLGADMALLDRMLTRQVNAILRHPRYRRLEGAWRGLRRLCLTPGRGGGQVIVRCLDVSWREIAADLDGAAELECAALFRLIHDEEFGMPGGRPYGVLLVDHEAPARAGSPGARDDISTLRGLASIGALAFAPVIVSAAPQLLGLNSFAELDRIPDDGGTSLIADPRFARLAREEVARFLCLALPRVLARPPHTPARCRPGFRYREDMDGLAHADLCWMSAVYAIGEAVITCFEDHGWFADLCRQPIGRPDIPATLDGEPDAPGVLTFSGVEIALSPAMEQALWREGLLAVGARRDNAQLVLRATPTIQVTPDGRSAHEANARISAILRYVLCVCRFAHYLKVMVRDRIGVFETVGACERFLQGWLDRYCVGDDDASPEMKARFPLREARVEVRGAPGRAGAGGPMLLASGALGCVIHLRPHVQLDRVDATFRLVTELSAGQSVTRAAPSRNTMLGAGP